MPDEQTQIEVESHESQQRGDIVGRWKPQISLLQLLLLVVIIALGAAYYASSQKHAEELLKQQWNFQQQFEEQGQYSATLHEKNRAIKILTNIYGIDEYVIQCKPKLKTSGAENYQVYVNLDPSQNTLLKIAYQDIPLQGYPETCETYLIPESGDKNTSGYSFIFDIAYVSKNTHENSAESFEGKFFVYTNVVKYDKNSIVQFYRHFNAIEKYVFTEWKNERSWYKTFTTKYEGVYYPLEIKNDQSNPIMRIRTKPDSNEPCTGILMWLEIPPKDAVLDGITLFEK